MKFLATVCAVALAAAVPLAGAQQAHHKKTKPAPTAPELAKYIRGQMLSLSPDDGFLDNQEVSF